MLPNAVIWVVWVGCLALSFVLSGMEAGVFALNPMRVRQQLRAGNKSARMLHGFLRNPERFLWGIFVGNTLTNFFLIGWVIVMIHSCFSHQPTWYVASLVFTVLAFYVLVDLLPKCLFRMFPTRLCLGLARAVRGVQIALAPLVRIVEVVASVFTGPGGGGVLTGRLFASREEFRAVMQESGRGLTADERLMINRVLDLQSMSVRQAMKPLQLAVTTKIDDTIESVKQLSRERGYMRFPVWQVQDNRRRIVGMLSLKNVIYEPDLDPTDTIARFVKPAVFLNENLPLEKAMRRMRRGGQRLAVVVGSNQREVGILALEDVFKLLFGQLTM